MATVVSVMVVPVVLFAVNAVVMSPVSVAVGIYDTVRCGFNYHDAWWRGIIIPVTVPVAIVIARMIRTISTG